MAAVAVDTATVTGEGVTVEVVADSVSMRYDTVRFVSENFLLHDELCRDYDRWLTRYARDLSGVDPTECFLRARGYSEATTQRVGADGSESSLTVDYTYTVWRHVYAGDGDWVYLDTSDPEEGVVTLSAIDGVTPDRFYGDNGTNYAAPMAYAVMPRATALAPRLVHDGQGQCVPVDWAEVESDILDGISEYWDGSYDGAGLWNFEEDVSEVHEDTLAVGEHGYPELEVTLGARVRVNPLTLVKEEWEHTGRRVRVTFYPPHND